MNTDCGHISVINFKGIERLEMDVRPFTVLIGPQSVGKSVTAELLFFFQNIAKEMSYNAALTGLTDTQREEGVIKDFLDAALINQFEDLLQIPTHLSGESVVKFCYPTGKIICLWHSGDEDAGWEIQLPDGFREQFKSLAAASSRLLDEPDFASALPELIRVQSHLESLLQSYFGNSTLLTPHFIPAGRSYFSKIERDVISFFESANLDPFVAEFGKFYSKVRTGLLQSKARRIEADSANKLIGELISGEYSRKEGQDFITTRDGRTLPASMWSSGQLEALPLALILDWCCKGLYGSQHGRALFIEEPEAHLFPASQQTITQLIALAFNRNLKGRPALQVFLTTHSPYILTSINNLLKAGQLFRDNPHREEWIAKIVPEEFALSPDVVGAFYMDRTGCRSIISDETGLIDASAIDEVSGKIAEQFDDLLNIQFP